MRLGTVLFVGIVGELSIPDVSVLGFLSGDTTVSQDNSVSGLLSGSGLLRLGDVQASFSFTHSDKHNKEHKVTEIIHTK